VVKGKKAKHTERGKKLRSKLQRPLNRLKCVRGEKRKKKIIPRKQTIRGQG